MSVRRITSTFRFLYVYRNRGLGMATLAGPARHLRAGALLAFFTVGAISVVQSDPLYQVPYNGHFTFTRIRYDGPGFRRFGGQSWSHDYPDADRNIQMILDEYTSLSPNTGGSNVVLLEDPRMFKRPLIYVSEPGYWSISEEGALNLRDYLLKGGFLIFDDFEANQWYNMDAQLVRALPERQWVELDDTHPIFGTFFYVEDIYVPHPSVAVEPRYMAIFEDNDPRKRVMVLANHNSDLAEYWEWSASGLFAVDPTNDAYRLGVNYIIYALTHSHLEVTPEVDPKIMGLPRYFWERGSLRSVNEYP